MGAKEAGSKKEESENKKDPGSLFPGAEQAFNHGE
jgi:hypothetical protein